MLKHINSLSLFFLCAFCMIACRQKSAAPENSSQEVHEQTNQAEQLDTPSEQKEPSIKYPFLEENFNKQKTISAHRGGGFKAGYPENAIASFQYAIDCCNAWIECDVRKTKDDVLILMHDESLDRTTTGTGLVHQKTWDEIKNLYLVDAEGNKTKFHPPSLAHVLEWNETKGHTVLTLDIKPDVKYEQISDLLHKYKQIDNCIAITYSLNQAKVLHRIDPSIVISLPIRGMGEWERFLKAEIPFDRTIAFTGTRRSSDELYETLDKNNIASIFGTLGNIDRQAKSRGNQVYKDLFDQGVDVISTDRPEACVKVISQ